MVIFSIGHFLYIIDTFLFGYNASGGPPLNPLISESQVCVVGNPVGKF